MASATELREQARRAGEKAEIARRYKEATIARERAEKEEQGAKQAFERIKDESGFGDFLLTIGVILGALWFLGAVFGGK